MELSLRALPYLFPDSQRNELRKWRLVAVDKERELAVRRQTRLLELNAYVKRRLNQLEEAKRQRSFQISGEQLQSSIRVKDNHKDTLDAVDAYSYPDYDTDSVLSAEFTSDVIPSDSSSDLRPGANSAQRQSISPRRRLFPPARPHKSLSSSQTKKDPYTILTALTRGFLTRRLLHSNKVNHHVQIIKDAAAVLNSLSESKTFSDMSLRERVTTQLHVAKTNLHEIFFDLPMEERMAYIAHARVLRQQQEMRRTRITRSQTVTLPVDNPLPAPPTIKAVPPSIRGRLSSATLKAIERRKISAENSHSVHSERNKKLAAKQTIKSNKPIGPVTQHSTKRVPGRTAVTQGHGKALKATGKENHRLPSRAGASKSTSRPTQASK